MKITPRLVNRFSRVKLLVVGDVMLDRFVCGDVSRINPEAPVPVLHVEGEYCVPGGAANAAANAAQLGAEVFLVGYVGKDSAARTVKSLLRRRRIHSTLVPAGRPTITKVRAIARGQQLLRLDYEHPRPPGRATVAKLLAAVKGLVGKVDAVLVSDYAKGVVVPELMGLLGEVVQAGGTVVVDPRPQHVDLYRGVTLVTPNAREAAECVQKPFHTHNDVEPIGLLLVERLSCHVLVTRGERGMCLFQRNGTVLALPTEAREVADVTGAGDTVAAVAALALGAGFPLVHAVKLANIAAGIVVSKVGTATLSIAELKRALKKS